MRICINAYIYIHENICYMKTEREKESTWYNAFKHLFSFFTGSFCFFLYNKNS